MPSDYIPKRDADLLAWSVNFDTLITAAPTDYGLDLAQAGAYTTLHDAFAAALQTATDPGTNSHSNIVIKNDAKAALIANARQLARIIQADPSVTNGQKALLGLTVRDTEPTPVPPPSDPPQVTIASVFGRTVTIRLRDINNPDNRAKPDGVYCAQVLTYVGDTPPASVGGWELKGSTTRTSFEIEFPASVEPGMQVWITAYWQNPRTQSGPAATPISTYIEYGGVAEAA